MLTKNELPGETVTQLHLQHGFSGGGGFVGGEGGFRSLALVADSGIEKKQAAARRATGRHHRRSSFSDMSVLPCDIRIVHGQKLTSTPF
jgi:hypothetical protein